MKAKGDQSGLRNSVISKRRRSNYKGNPITAFSKNNEIK